MDVNDFLDAYEKIKRYAKKLFIKEGNNPVEYEGFIIDEDDIGQILFWNSRDWGIEISGYEFDIEDALYEETDDE